MTPGDDLSLMLMLAGICLAVFCAVVAIPLIAGGLRNRQAKRVAALRQRWQRHPSAEAAAGLMSRPRGEPLPGFILALLPRPHILRQQLARTGLSLRLTDYVLISVGSALMVFGVLALVDTFPPAVNAASGIAAGIWLPRLLVDTLVRRRQKRFTHSFAEAIDLMVRGLRSGLPITECVRSVSEEMSGPVAEEFRRVAELQRFGQTLEQALERAADRVDTQEIRFFVIALSVQRETGGNLAETLENLSDVLRSRQRMKMKIQALSAEPKASASILGALPTIMFGVLFLVNAGYVMELFTDPRGHFMVALGLVSQGIGIAVMARMIRFDI